MKVETLNTKTWQRYTGGAMCKGCWAGCCTMPVQVDAEDLHVMGFLEAHQVNGPLKRIAIRLKREGIIRSFNVRTGRFILQQKNGTDCIFLDHNRMCTIYERRPSVCRRFPENSMRPGFCPCRPK